MERECGMKNPKWLSVLKRIGAVVCAGLTALSLIACFLLSFFQSTLMSEEFFVSACDEKYLSQVKGYIVDHLSEEIARYEESEQLQKRLAEQCVDMQTVEECTKEYLKGLYRAFHQGETLEKVQYPVEKMEPFRQHVLSVSQQEGYEVDEENLTQLLNDLCSLVTADMNSFNFNLVGMSSLSVIRLVHEKLFSNETLMAPLRISVAVPAVLTLLFGAGVFFLTGGKNWLRKSYNTLTFLWAGSALLFFPVLLFHIYDLPARLAITPSPVKSLLDSILYHLIDGLLVPAAVCFGVFSAALVVLIVLQMLSYAKTLKAAADGVAEISPEEASALWLEGAAKEEKEEEKKEEEKKEESSSEETQE